MKCRRCLPNSRQSYLWAYSCAILLPCNNFLKKHTNFIATLSILKIETFFSCKCIRNDTNAWQCRALWLETSMSKVRVLTYAILCSIIHLNESFRFIILHRHQIHISVIKTLNRNKIDIVPYLLISVKHEEYTK